VFEESGSRKFTCAIGDCASAPEGEGGFRTRGDSYQLEPIDLAPRDTNSLNGRVGRDEVALRFTHATRSTELDSHLRRAGNQLTSSLRW
jgi:hypothetical protein